MNRPKKCQQKPFGAKKNKRLRLQGDVRPVNSSIQQEIPVSRTLQIAIAYHQAGQLQQADVLYRQILQTDPNCTDALNLLGIIAYQNGELEVAVELINQAIRLNSSVADYFSKLGLVLRAQHKLDAAIESYQKAIVIKPDCADTYNNMGVAFYCRTKPDAAIDCYRKALAIRPDYIDALINIADAHMQLGLQQQAISFYEKGLAYNPSCAQLHHSLIFAASRWYADDGAKVFELSKKFGEQFDANLARQPHQNDLSSVRRLKIGYVSGDFRQHSVAYFIEPILANHDKQQVEIFCYYNLHTIDEVTRQLMTYADHWRSISGLADQDVEKLIRQDAIDILVDLSGHTAYNRLLLFARKPAPVQVSWIGYPVTTGLSALDYRLTNPYIDPPGWNERYHTENLFRLSTSTCFQPEGILPEINPLPALSNGYLTFASFHAPNKITPITMALWAKLLLAVPTSRLALCPDTSKDQITRQFHDLGISSGRLDFFCKRSLPEYLVLHNEVDVMLDTFPYNGGTVSRHSLWMGVPILTFAGRQAVSRVGLSLMTQLGLETFVADCDADFIDNACRWAGDLNGLAKVRSTLREKIQNAPFSKPTLVVKELEAAYRQMWHKWCQQHYG